MPAPFRKHIEQYVRISDADYSGIMDCFTERKLRKKENLLTEGSICQHQYFVTKGLLRMFFVNDKGIEQTIQFALENWWISDYTSFASRKPSEMYIQAVEPAEVLSISFDAQETLLQAHPNMERYFRFIHQRAHAAYQFRIKYLYDLSREEMYHHFNRHYPEFVQRVPQYLLASFLGFTPEYLSEIRSRRIS